MNLGKKIYFASDMHLGAPDPTSSLSREKRLVAWLKMVSADAEEIHLVGDVLDFWFEYKKSVPKGFTRLFGALAEICDRGIKVYWYLGNHDMWLFDYLPAELGVVVTDSPVRREWSGKRFYIAHGDGLGPGDHGYKFLKRVFRNKICQWLFARLHPNFGIGLAEYFSSKSRSHGVSGQEGAFLGEDKEWLIIHSKEVLAKEDVDYFIYGHRHLPGDRKVGTARYVNLGDWIEHFTYAVFDGLDVQLKEYRDIAS